jgi:hypothetical protein
MFEVEAWDWCSALLLALALALARRAERLGLCWLLSAIVAMSWRKIYSQMQHVMEIGKKLTCEWG